MTRTLISFLGRVPKGEGGYRTTRYTFGDGSRTEPVAFFGWPLQRRLAARRMVVLGTAGSMWDHLTEGDLELGSAREADRLRLIERTSQKSVEQDDLAALEPVLSERLGCELRLRIIPYARTREEQMQVLAAMAAHVEAGDEVHLDVSHGFRHLPMLALLAALFLRRVRRARIEGIWYGSFDPDTGQADVFELSALLGLADGLDALAQFEKDGDYGVFEPLLRAGGVDAQAIEPLRRAAYYENILNVGEATGQLRRARAALRPMTLSPELALLWPTIERRLAWLDEDRQFQKQTRLARQCFERRDYLRATLYAFEAVITRLCQREGVPITDFEAREQARQRYEAAFQGVRTEESLNYHLLKNLRNQVAHGTRGSTGEVQQALLNEANMCATLDRLIKAIETGRLPAER
ncbi:MAG: TIGR02221 family CRISPR-associated protein [Casimicrobiaceae bacterium]|nr:TIGR02221 family CRISPR-associated protein [Casimicrobiaceae bacterium]